MVGLRGPWALLMYLRNGCKKKLVISGVSLDSQGTRNMPVLSDCVIFFLKAEQSILATKNLVCAVICGCFGSSGLIKQIPRCQHTKGMFYELNFLFYLLCFKEDHLKNSTDFSVEDLPKARVNR